MCTFTISCISRIKNKAAIYIAALFLVSCSHDKKQDIIPIEVHSESGGMPFLFDSGNTVYLSWIEYADDTTDVLKFSSLDNAAWSPPRIIASGTDWFVNWADYPSIVVFGKEHILAAHWLQKSAAGTYDYDIKISLSYDGGRNWSKAFVPHLDGVQAEHGFVSMVPYNDSLLFACWLDGRHTKSSHSHDHHGSGSMTLRSAFINPEGKVFNSSELDSMVCDCCQTSAAVEDNRIYVAYRDRTENEIRDISLITNHDKFWEEARDVSGDSWKIAGCPVNGPSIDARESNIALAWYTMEQDSGRVYIKISGDYGKSFGQDIRIDHGNPLGRVKLAYGKNGTIFICWLEMDGDKAKLMLNKTDGSGNILREWTVRYLDPGRQSGFPALVARNDEVILAWTEHKDKSMVKSTRIKI